MVNTEIRLIIFFAAKDGEVLCMHAKLLQSCLTLCGRVDYTLPGCSVHRILQARILEWVVISFSRGKSSVQSAKTKPVADCGSDHELFIAKFRLK